MPIQIFTALGFVVAMTLPVSSAVAAQPRPLAPGETPAQILVTIDVTDGFSTRLLCLTPSKYGTSLVPQATVPRRTCLSEREWAARHVRFADD